MNRVCSIFVQLLQFIPRAEFAAAARQHNAERHAYGFTCWTQLVAMLFCDLGRAQALREIEGGLAASQGKLRHLGVKVPPKRSTLPYANAHRAWQVFPTVFTRLYERFSAELWQHGRRRFRFRHKLLSLNATPIPLCVSLFG